MPVGNCLMLTIKCLVMNLKIVLSSKGLNKTYNILRMKSKMSPSLRWIQGVLCFLLIIIVSSCGPNHLWTFDHDIQLDDISPNGITIIDDEIWIADTDNNRLVRIDEAGAIQKQIEEVDRPMHISQHDGKPLVPEYGSDLIRVLNNGIMESIAITAEPDAPASVDVSGDRIVIADFYNHRVIYELNGVEHHIGKKGDEDGEFHYPTDVQFFEDQIFVADAYNHRVQRFNLQGEHQQTIADDSGINAATGIFVNEEFIVITDFENDRVLTYSHEGEQLDIMAEGFHRPTDVLIHDNQLYVLNFKGKFISVFN